MLYPHDQSPVLFKDKQGISREGKYVLSMQAFIELAGDEGPEDCSNVFPETDIIQWEYLERSEMDGGLIEAF